MIKPLSDRVLVKMKESEEEIGVKVDYALEINYEHLADCTIDVRVRAKNGNEWNLS